MVHKQTRITAWKAPGPDGLKGHWLKSFSSLSERIADQVDEYLQLQEVAGWMTKGETHNQIPRPRSGGNKFQADDMPSSDVETLNSDFGRLSREKDPVIGRTEGLSANLQG